MSGAKRVGEGASEVTDLADVDGDVGVVRAGCDREGMPLVVADFRAVEEQPLSGLVLHARLGELNLNSVVRVANDFDDLGLAPATDFAVKTVHQVQAATNELPTPTLVSNTVCPEVVVIERREGWRCVSYEAASCVCVHAEQERNKEMVGVPEGFEGLLSDPVVSGRVH